MINNEIQMLKNIGLTMGVISVYDTNEFTAQELISMCVNKVNEMISEYEKYGKEVDERLSEFKKLLDNMNQGIKEEVFRRIEVLYSNGALEDLINQTALSHFNQRVEGYKNQVDSYLEIMKNVKGSITKNIVSEGIIGDGKTNNADKFKKLFENLSDGDVVFLPFGNYLIELNDEILTKGSNGNYLIKIQDKKNISIIGSGRIIIKSEKCRLKNWLFNFYNCEDVIISGIQIIGDVELVNGTVLRDTIPNLILFEKSNNLILEKCYFEKFGACAFTGNGSSPSTTSDIAHNIMITNNIFKNFGQISTYGGGANGFIFNNNICINSFQSAVKISSHPLENETTIGNAQNIMIENNLIKWEKSCGFPIVAWDNTKRYAPVGVMIQSHSRDIKITNNIIDLSNIEIEIKNPIHNITCISVYKGNNNTSYYNKDIVITDNSLFSAKKNNAVVIAPFVDNLLIEGNTINGYLKISSLDNGYNKASVKILDNLIRNTTNYNYININFEMSELIVKDNIFESEIELNGYSNLFEISKLKAKKLVFDNNIMNNGKIYTTKTIEVDDIHINDNSLSLVNLTNKNNNLMITSNTFDKVVTPILIKNENENSYTNISFNKGLCSSFINIDKGDIILINNAMKTKSNNVYQINSCKVLKGELLSNGAPNFNANVGVTCIDMSQSKDSFYMKTSNETNTGWKKINFS